MKKPPVQIYVPSADKNDDLTYRLSLKEEPFEIGDGSIIQETIKLDVLRGNVIDLFNPKVPEGSLEEIALKLAADFIHNKEYGTDKRNEMEFVVVRKVEHKSELDNLIQSIEDEVEKVGLSYFPHGVMTPSFRTDHLETKKLEDYDEPYYAFVFRLTV